jgi:hypothetical protein
MSKKRLVHLTNILLVRLRTEELCKEFLQRWQFRQQGRRRLLARPDERRRIEVGFGVGHGQHKERFPLPHQDIAHDECASTVLAPPLSKIGHSEDVAPASPRGATVPAILDDYATLDGMQVPTNLRGEYTTGFRTIFPDLAAANAATLMPFLLEGVGGIPALNLPDGIHPNPAGHKIIAENVWQILEPVLQTLQAP